MPTSFLLQSFANRRNHRHIHALLRFPIFVMRLVATGCVHVLRRILRRL